MLVVRLSDIPEEKRKEYVELIEKSIPKPFDEFNENNLRYTIEHLDLMKGSVVLLPLEYAANYVDGIWKKQVDENSSEALSVAASFKHGQILKSDQEYSQMNATAVGNIAYAVLNIKEPEVSEIFMDFYTGYAEWYAQMIEKISDKDLEELAVRNGISPENCKKYFSQGMGIIKKMQSE